MSSILAELIEMKTVLAGLRVDLSELEAEAWKDGKLDESEKFDIQQANDTIELAEKHIARLEMEIGVDASEGTAEEIGETSALGFDKSIYTPERRAYEREQAAAISAMYDAREAAKDPGVTSKANGLAKRDQDLAREIYGDAWTQLALADKAYDDWDPPDDEGPDGHDIFVPYEKYQESIHKLKEITAMYRRVVLMFEMGDRRAAGAGGDAAVEEQVAEVKAGVESDGGEDKGGETDTFTPPTEVNEPTLRKGDEDADGWVEYLQSLLNFHLGAGTVQKNGKFDQKTHTAVSTFQAAAGCQVDGVVGNQTWSALRKDKKLDEIGTDGREPHSHSEQGPEGRWGLESTDIGAYKRDLDAFSMTVVSVGTESIEGFPVVAFVNGEKRDCEIGPPLSGADEGKHRVLIKEFVARHGNVACKIEAYLPPELGGDKWSAEYTKMFEGDKDKGESNGEDKGGETDTFTPPTEVNEPTLRKGDEDADGWVEYLQSLLNFHLGAGTVQKNGKFDQKTHTAVTTFQAAAGCQVDGVVGNQTWSALRKDKQLDEIGTDGREPHSHSEQGPEGRWGLESTDIGAYKRDLDAFSMTVVSVGMESIEGFPVVAFVNGEKRDCEIGPPLSGADEGKHRVLIKEFVARHGNVACKIEAYLPPELGGDKWSAEYTKMFEDDKDKGGSNGGDGDEQNIKTTGGRDGDILETDEKATENTDDTTGGAQVPKDISGSVGRGGKNAPDDVSAVQQLLNNHGDSLDIDGQVGPKTIGAITKFQQSKLGFADGRVDPGGKTWAALCGGAGESGGGTDGGDGASGGGAEPPDLGEPPEPEVKVEYDHDDQTPGPGKPREVIEETYETTFDSVMFGEIKIKRNQHGDVLEVNIEPRLPFQKLSMSVGDYMEIAVQPLKIDYNFAVSGKKIQFEVRLGAKAGAAVAYGFDKYGTKLQIKGEASMEGYAPSPYRAVIDTEDLANSNIEPNDPIIFALGGGASCAVVAASGGFEFSETLSNYNYEKLLILELAAGPRLELKPGPDYEKLKEDLIGEAVEKAKSAGLNNDEDGAGGGDASSDTAQTGWSDKASETASKAMLSNLRSNEAAMRSAFSAGWEDPNLVGKANALYQQDQAMAKQLYGQAWTQRALAKQSFDAYGSPLDTAPIDIIAARSEQAKSIASKFHNAIALFKQGDAGW